MCRIWETRKAVPVKPSVASLSMLNNDWSVSSSLNKSSLLLCVDNTYRVRQRRCAPWPQGTGKHPTVRNKSIDFFAFTNGKPHTCFSIEDVHQLEVLGARKIFSTVNGVNKDVGNTLLGRVNTHATDESSYQLWCRVGLSYSNFS